MKYKEFIFAGKYLSPFHAIFLQRIPIQNIFDQNCFSFVNRFSNVLLHILRQIGYFVYIYTLKNISEKSLSGTRKHTKFV